jgi:hypothetical protein
MVRHDASRLLTMRVSHTPSSSRGASRRRCVSKDAFHGHNTAISQANPPRALQILCPNEGAGNAGRIDAPAALCAKVESTQVSHHGHTGNTRHSPRNGFNGFLRALPGEPGLLSPSAAQRVSVVAVLTPASGRQDHTTSPSASSALVLSRQSVHRIPHPTLVTIAKRPSCGHETRGLVEMICPTGKVENLFGRDWTEQIRLKGFDKFNFWRKQLCAGTACKNVTAPFCQGKSRASGQVAGILFKFDSSSLNWAIDL